MYRLILTLALLFLVLGCRTHKDISSQSKTWNNQSSSDSTVQKVERINTDWVRINQSLLRRDGMMKISFDSLASVTVLPDLTIQAIGYNPRIESTTSEVQQLDVRDSIRAERTDSLNAALSKKKEDSGSEESSSRIITKKPSLTPWIGAGLAVAIVVLAVLYYFFWRR